ncbi:hypothetical protein OUZ56_008112 [Daphnia magna]|uniref:Uncharacterized protein n=1 Tax=Daphnia magna TaxID=35525 RepID=A0ABR0AC04_9CRUS|nr:hypothetical protein OUZ56_008112 [Daphnia magna]
MDIKPSEIYYYYPTPYTPHPKIVRVLQFEVCKLATVYESKVTQLHLVQGPERCQAKHDDNS